jgi:hypothetical protein
MSIPEHIADLLEDYLDGQLDHAGRDELYSWVRGSDANCKSLAQWFVDEVQLLEATRVADMRDVFGGMAFEARAVAPQLNATTRSKLRTRPLWLGTAAAVIISFAAALLWSSGEASKVGRINNLADRDSAESAKSEQSPPAILARVANCIWSSRGEPFRVGQDISAGTTIDLESGLAQLVFDSGAEVVLRGPCQFRVDGSMLCSLARGSVSAEVPPRAAGFTIRGPSAEVIDLGTRFGFSVGTAGESEVHVFKGQVISRQLDERGQVYGDEILLQQDQAVLYPGERQEAQRLAADEAKFAVAVQPLWRQDQIEPLVVQRKLALWLRASHGVLADEDSKVFAWQDLAHGENHIANDAFQPDRKSRPRFVADALGGRPAIRFDGKASYLTTTPMTTRDDQTIVVAFQHAPRQGAGQRIGGQIINYNGPPSRYLPDSRNPGVLQLGEKVDAWNAPMWSIGAKAFVGLGSGGTPVSTGVVHSESLGHSNSKVVAYIYNNTDNVAALYVDGIRVAEALAPTSVAVTSRKVIGKHGIFDQWYFRGDLGELLIYNDALNHQEIGELSKHLMDYYRVDAD